MTKPRGRPRLDATDTTVSVHVRISSKAFDAAQKRAQAERLTLRDFIRQAIAAGAVPPFRPPK
jgi:predicted DNA binding CopG/RHH family protein